MATRSYSEFPDSDSVDRSRGFRAAMARIFGDAEHPLSWSIPIGTVAGIRIRMHLLFLIYAVAQVLWSINSNFFGPGYTSLAMAALFGVVLLHEFGHCLACRNVGGEANEILLWPLGGLASCNPPDHWKPHLITTLGGPAVNVIIAPITSLALWAAGRPGTILFNPFEISGVFFELTSWWLVALWLLHAMNLVILAFNILLPIFPLDGGRVAHALIWRQVGRRRATEIATIVGLASSAGLAVFALVADTTLLLGVAIFCALICWVERQRLTAPEFLGGDFGGFGDPDPIAAQRESRTAEKKRKREAAEQAELDRILAKIANRGMDSLSVREKRTLRMATKKKQQGR